jgi:hypothetical protein
MVTEKGYEVPNLSISFLGKANWQRTAVGSKEKKGQFHGIYNGVAFSGGRSAGTKENNSRLTYWSVVDLIDGNGIERGYFSYEHSAGRDRGTFKGSVTTSGNGLNLSGTWTLSERPDNLTSFNGTGNGTYDARITAGMNFEIWFVGSLETAQAAAHC